MERIEKLIKTFHLISGMSIGLYDRQYHSIFSAGMTDHSFCDAVHSTPEGIAKCFRSDVEAFEIVTATKRPYVFTCPYGLAEAMVPVIQNGDVVAFLFVGRAIKNDARKKSFAIHSALPYVDSGHTERDVRELVNALCSFNDCEHEAFVETLKIFADKISNMDIIDLHEKSLAELIRDHLDNSYTDRITLAKLSLHFHCSSVTLTENFRKEYGTTIMSYVLEKRMEEAKRLLLSTNLTIGEIAERCGFAGIEHFSKTFKKHNGLSPARHRENHT